MKVTKKSKHARKASQRSVFPIAFQFFADSFISGAILLSSSFVSSSVCFFFRYFTSLIFLHREIKEVIFTATPLSVQFLFVVQIGHSSYRITFGTVPVYNDTAIQGNTVFVCCPIGHYRGTRASATIDVVAGGQQSNTKQTMRSTVTTQVHCLRSMQTEVQQ